MSAYIPSSFKWAVDGCQQWVKRAKLVKRAESPKALTSATEKRRNTNKARYLHTFGGHFGSRYRNDRKQKAAWIMDVLVCGGRNISDKSKVFDVLDSLSGRLGIARIFYRAADNPDQLACEWADRRNVPTYRFTPSWESNGKTRASSSANQKRGSQKPHLVLAFPGDEDLVRQAKAIGLTVIEIDREAVSSQVSEPSNLAAAVAV